MIQLEGISLAPGGEPLLIEATWHLRTGQRVGLVGRNGTGKTTLLRAIVGERDPDEGRVNRRSGIALGWLPQQAVAGSDRTVWDEARQGLTRLRHLQDRLTAAEHANEAREPGAIERLDAAAEAFRIAGGYRIDERIGEVLHGLGFGPDAWRRPCAEFSGGWQMRIALAKVLLADPDVLVLDEPTNHLDMHARSWLARFLARTPATVLLVSHDRHLLDAACTEILEIRGRALHTYTGNFSAFLAQRDERLAREREAFANQQDEIARLERFVERFRAKATKAAQARSRQNRLDRMDRLSSPEPEKLPRLRLPPAPAAEAELVAIDRATLGWSDDAPVLTDVTLTLARGVRAVMLGPNGAGKSTLLQTLAGRLRPLSGRRRQGQRVKIGVFDQDQAAALPRDRTALEHLMTTNPRVGEPRGRALLGALGLAGEDAMRPIADLSGGEKARVALACLAATEHNVLLLDEPTNHLDAVTVEVLVRALTAFDGALVVSTHDRFVAESIATHVIRVDGGRAEVKEGLLPEDLEPTAARREGDRAPSIGAGAVDHEARKQLRRELDRARKRATAIEAEVAALDATLAEIDERLFAQAADFDRARALGEERARAEERQLERIEEWEAIGSRIDEIEAQLT